jgi:hypothetical protein
MRNASFVILAAGLAFAGCSKQESAAPAKTDYSATTSGNPATAPVDYLGAVGKAKKFSEKVVDTASLNQAIQLFYAQEDRFPKDLNELVKEKYLASLPTPPPGTRFDYNPQSGTVKVVRQQ